MCRASHFSKLSLQHTLELEQLFVYDIRNIYFFTGSRYTYTKNKRGGVEMDENAKKIAKKIIEKKDLNMSEQELIEVFEKIISFSFAPTSTPNLEQLRKLLDHPAK